jgi:2-polyprenyl-3-methyl-5-hydroxy-6-metoxy-1,4-benzoquinol methylase
MKLSKKDYQIILARWETRGINSPSNKLFKASEAQSKFSHKPESKYFEFVPCPICREDNYAIFHKKTTFMKYRRNKFVNAIIEVLVSLLGGKIISKIFSFLLRKEVNVFQYQYRVVQCSQCGFLYRNPTYRMRQIKKVYNKNYLKFLAGSYSSEREKMYKDVLERLDFDKRTADFERRRVLDIGCGIGLFLNYIRSKEWDTYGLDFAEDCIKYAQQEFNLHNVQVGNLNKDTYKESYFDVVTLWSVAAHLEDPINMFIKIHNVLRPGGLLLVYTINAGSLQHKYYLDKWNGFWGNHLVFFDSESLRTALEKSGFSSLTNVYDDRDFNHWSKDNTILKEDINYFSELMQKGNMGNMLMVLATNGI